MPSKKKRFNARFPPARIKRIMQKDEQVGKLAQAVPFIMSKSLESFAEELLTISSQITRSRNARTLTQNHMKTAIFNKPEFNFLRDITKTISDVNPVEEDNTLQNNNNNINSEDNRLATTNTSTIIFSSNNNSSNSRVRQINMVNNPSLPISYIPTSVPATLNQINNNNCHNVPRTRGRPRKRPMDVDSEPSCSSTSKTAKKKLKGKTNYSDDDDDSELEDNDDDNESTSEDEEGDDDNDDHIDEDDTQETKETGENVSSNYPFDLSMKFNSSKKSSTITSTNNIFGAPNEQIPNDEDDYDNC